MVKLTRIGSPAFRPVAWRSTAGRLPAASWPMTSSGTTIPVLLPLAATVVSNVTLWGSDAICSATSRCWISRCGGNGRVVVASDAV